MKKLFSLLFTCCALIGATPAPLPTNQPPVDHATFTVPCVDELVDLHGDPIHADLVVFAGGNEWFAMPEIFEAFQKAHPEVVHIYYETLPPGILALQMRTGKLAVGDLLIAVQPDVFIAGKRRMDLARKDGAVGEPVTFGSNVLSIMVRAGNPKKIRSLSDLGRADVKVAMPNPATEGIARQIEASFKKAGGDALDDLIVRAKVAEGTTTLTSIHHRQTPMWILQGKVDAGPVWITEALYQERIQSGLASVAIPKNENARGIYQAAVVTRAAHVAAAKAFQEFLMTPQAQAIYRSYGFDQGTTTDE